mmetsp:Transcript_8314/g.17963  ORF Transcript_8314/g.17963 Transcript_8314/m.17963 type:complete len:162 (+) Transcript_8314:2428-2913(+)
MKINIIYHSIRTIVNIISCSNSQTTINSIILVICSTHTLSSSSSSNSNINNTISNNTISQHQYSPRHPLTLYLPTSRSRLGTAKIRISISMDLSETTAAVVNLHIFRRSSGSLLDTNRAKKRNSTKVWSSMLIAFFLLPFHKNCTYSTIAGEHEEKYYTKS